MKNYKLFATAKIGSLELKNHIVIMYVPINMTAALKIVVGLL